MRGHLIARLTIMADKDQKTEQPTQRRLKKAREEGKFPTARVFVGALQFLAFVGSDSRLGRGLDSSASATVMARSVRARPGSAAGHVRRSSRSAWKS